MEAGEASGKRVDVLAAKLYAAANPVIRIIEGLIVALENEFLFHIYLRDHNDGSSEVREFLAKDPKFIRRIDIIEAQVRETWEAFVSGIEHSFESYTRVAAAVLREAESSLVKYNEEQKKEIARAKTVVEKGPQWEKELTEAMNKSFGSAIARLNVFRAKVIAKNLT